METRRPSAPHTAPAPAPVRRQRRWLRRVMMAIALLLIALSCLLGVAWWWAGQDDSLSRTLARIASWMPSDQKLEADGVQGSLRNGGRIDWLRWTSPAMQVEIKGADITWRLQPLLSRELRFGRINMDELRIRSTPQPKEDTPTEPLQSLELPLRLDVPLRIERVVWEGPPETVITELYGHYAYTGLQHQLDVSSLRYAGSLYEAQAKLQSAAPMQLQAALQGHIQAPLPNQPEHLLRIEAQAQVQGTLATEAARLNITAKAHTAQAQDRPDTAQTLTADVTAVLRPWLPQPVEQAQADLRNVDVALFMPNGPRTQLNGSVQAGPEGPGWKLQTTLHNSIPGPWDQGSLPVRTLMAEAHFDGLQTWLLQQARIDLGKTGTAHLQAQGRFDSQTQALEGQVDLVAINPADLYSTLEASPLSGNVQAKSGADQQVQFKLNVQSPKTDNHTALHLAAARAEGTWQAPVLQVRQLYLDALQTQLQSESLRLNTDTQHVEGKLQATLPGAQAVLDLNAGPDAGQGTFNLDLRFAEQLAQWLAKLPLATDPLAGAKLQGKATAQLQWRGGWSKLQQRLQNPAAPRQLSGLQLSAQVAAPQLRYQPAEGEPMEIQQLKLAVSGSPEKLQIKLQSQAKAGSQSISLDTDLTAGLLNAPNAAPRDWQASIAKLQARWSPQDTPATTWDLQLAAPITASQQTTGNPVRSMRIQAGAGRLMVAPPSSVGSQAASVEWEPLLLRQAGNGSWAIQSKGRLQGVPMVWVDAFSPTPNKPLLASAGISGDLAIQGHWDINTTGRQWRADVLLERASGDIRLSVEDSDAAPVTVVRSTGASEINAATQQVRSPTISSGRGMRARLQALRLQISAQGNEVRTQLVWNAERAGQIHADLRSQISQTADGFAWPDSAPLSGTVKASMPNIGIWAFFAPPGWRVGGTLNADVAISGTRSAPLWNGHLSADQLSVLSLLDGVDLRDGRLRARLQGTRLDITELFFKGGQGSSTRILGKSGNLTPAPKDGGTLTGSGFVAFDPNAPEDSSGISMDIRLVAERLQVLVRADRQLSVSGDLQAGMNNGQVTLRGNLKIDRAAIILADASAPSLGPDVHITSAASRQAAIQTQTQAGGAVQATKPPDIAVQLNLGDDFALQGYGITTRLEGQLKIANGPSITGEIHTVNGRYRAWGQSLDVESGTIRFSGPYANPAIDIVAFRPNLEVKAGVEVTGSVDNPRVTLLAEPDMPDAEKLSWLVMGRSAAAGGAETALLQQAALALLSGGGDSGNFASQLGLDEIGFKGPSEDGGEAAAITVGKRLSKDLYVAYEQSLNGAMGTLFIFYDLSRRLTLRGQTGEQTAVDLIYTKTMD